MILIDPELDLGPARQLRGLSRSPVAGSAGSRPSAGDASPRSNWRRSALPWAERVPTPQTLTRFLAQAQEAVGLRGQVTVLLTTDAAMLYLNRRFRGKNKPTDVLSFPIENLVRDQGKKEKGDLAISVETARRQAAEQGHALTCELKVLMLHGVLHLAGYDHENDTGEMELRERILRARLGLPLGLIERAASPTLSQNARKDGAGRKEKHSSGAKAPTRNRSVSARLKSRPDTVRSGKP